MQATMQSIQSRHLLRWSVFFATAVHVLLILALILLDFIPMPKPRTVRISIKGTGGVMTMNMNPHSGSKEKLGVQRKIDVANATPPQIKPKPKPIAPKPENKPVIKPLATPKAPPTKTVATKKEKLPPVISSKKTFVSKTTKKILAAPTPKEEEPKEKRSLTDKGSDQGSKKKIDDSLPDLADAAALPNLSDTGAPVVAQKGKEDGNGDGMGTGPGGGLPSIGIEGGISLPAEYLIDSIRRITPNFIYPSTINSRLTAIRTCIAEFRIGLDGKIAEVSIRQSTGDPILDVYAQRALENTKELLPLRDYLKQDIGKDYVVATIPFSFVPQAQ